MKFILFAIAAAFTVGIVNAAVSDPSPAPRPGMPQVYARIEAMTDCDELQAQFDQAAENHERDKGRQRLDLMKVSTSYMLVADARMRQIGCY